MGSFTVIYDACVLYPAPLRDLLVQLATTGLFRAKWTDAIHEEWMRSVLDDRKDLRRGQLERTKRLMNESVLDSLVTGYEHLIPSVELPDENDRHIVAAAIHARADAIVTYNLRDFPADRLSKFDLEAIHPDDFIHYQTDLNEADVVIAAQRCRKRLKNPPIPAEEYLNILEARSLPKAVAALRKYTSIL